MTEGSSKAKEIALGDELGEIAVKANGVRVEIHSDGSIVAHTRNDVDAYTDGEVHVHPAVNDDRKPAGEAAPKIGDVMPAGHRHAGWIYAGISKTTYEPFYVAPKDSGVFQWKEAMAFAAKDGSRVPSKEELDQIYEARNQGALKDTFNVTGSLSAGWYWSSRGYYVHARAQRFSDGYQSILFRTFDSSLRCVR